MNVYMDRDLLFEQHTDFNYLKELYRRGALGGLNSFERDLLQFCHDRDMRQYLKENVWDKPIVIDDDGNIDYSRTKFQSQTRQPIQTPLNTYNSCEPQVPQMPRPQQPISEQKFYYLYDDNGNLVAAIPKR